MYQQAIETGKAVLQSAPAVESVVPLACAMLSAIVLTANKLLNGAFFWPITHKKIHIPVTMGRSTDGSVPIQDTDMKIRQELQERYPGYYKGEPMD